MTPPMVIQAFIVVVAVLAVAAQAVNVQLMGVHGSFEDSKFTQYSLDDEDANVAMSMAAYMCENQISTVISEFSEMSSICPDLNITFSATDSQFDAASAVQAFLAGINEGTTDFVVGPQRSVSAVPLSLIASSENIGIISPEATADDLSSREEYGNFYRVIPTDDDTAKVTAKLMKYYGFENVGLVYLEDTYGTSYRDSLNEHFIDQGISLYSQGFTMYSESEAYEAMATLNEADLNIVLIVAYGDDLVNLVDYAVENGMMDEGKLIIFMDVVTRSELAAIAATSEAHKQALLYQQHIVLDRALDTTVTQNFLAQWTALASDSAFLEYVNARLPLGSKFLQPRRGSYSERVVDASFFNYSSGRDLLTDVSMSFDAVAATCRAYCLAYQAFDGNVTTIENVLSMITDSSFNFSGLTGQIVVDESTGTRNVTSIQYELASVIYYGDNLAFDRAGFWTGSSWMVSDSILFPGNTTTIPDDTYYAGEDLNLILQGLRGLVWALMVIVELMCIFFVFWVRANRHAKVIVKSQPHFLIISLIGVMISTSSVIPLGIDEGIVTSQFGLNFSCNAWIALWTYGNTIIYGALMAKLYRIMRIFNNPNLRSMRIRNKDLYWFIASLLGITSVVVITWFSLEPRHWARVDDSIDSYGNVLSSHGVCTDYTNIATIFMAIIFCKNGLKLIGCVAMAFKCRHVDKTFQESSYIFMAVASMLQLYLLGIPVIFAVAAAETSIRFLVFGMIVCISNGVLTGLILIPKMRQLQIINTSNSDKSNNYSNSNENSSSIRTSKETKFNREDTDVATALRHQPPSISFAEMYPTRASEFATDASDSEDDTHEYGSTQVNSFFKSGSKVSAPSTESRPSAPASKHRP